MLHMHSAYVKQRRPKTCETKLLLLGGHRNRVIEDQIGLHESLQDEILLCWDSNRGKQPGVWERNLDSAQVSIC